MLLLGVLSVLQLILIPGLLLIRLFPGRRSTILQAAYVFVLSLLANYVAVFFLVAVGLYYRSVVLVLFAAQVASLLWLYRDELLKPRKVELKKLEAAISRGFKFLADWLAKDFWLAVVYIAAAVLAGLAAYWILNVWVQNFGTVYQVWDSWASWDRWAQKWADNRLPLDTWEYPQMVPILLSISYKFIGTVGIKFFGKSIMPLFGALVVFVLIEMGRRFKSSGYLAGAVLALYSLNLFLGRFFPEVYVDIPVASLSLLAVCTLLLARHTRDINEVKTLLALGSLSTAAAAVTKQTGLYIFAVYPLFAYLWVLKGHKQVAAQEARRILGKNLLLALLIVVPWYAFIQYNILTGRSVSNIEYVTQGIYAGQSYWERFVTAVGSLRGYVYLFVFALVSLPVLAMEFRHLLLLVVLPFSVLWAVFLSYEHRNLAVALPLLSMTVGVAAEAWFRRGLAFLNRQKVRVPALVAGLVLLAFASITVVTLDLTRSDLAIRQWEGQELIFDSALNRRLYGYFSRTIGPEPVITSYPVDWLAGLDGYWRREQFSSRSAFLRSLQRYADATLVLVPTNQTHPAIMEYIIEQLIADEYEIQFEEGEYWLIRIPAER